VDLLDELKLLLARLDLEEIDYALCGGLAMAVYALPRATLDIDLLIEASSLARAARAVHKLGFTLSATPLEFHDGTVRIHRVSKIEPETGETLVLDFLLVTPDLEPVWRSRAKVDWEGGTLSVVSAEGLIVLKSLRGSGQDQDDIRHLRSILDED